MANTTGLKFGGRAKGTPNKGKNTELKDALEKASREAVEGILEDFSTLTTNEKLKLLATCLRYVMPQLKATEMTLDASESIPKWAREILEDNE